MNEPGIYTSKGNPIMTKKKTKPLGPPLKYTWVNLGDHVWEFSGTGYEENGLPFEPGFYFLDETEAFQGPFTSAEIARNMRDRWGKEML